MPDFGTQAGVQARLGSRGSQISATSRPSLANVDTWLDEAEAELLGAIQQGGGGGALADYPANSRGNRTIRGWVERRVAGQVAQAHARSGGEGNNDDGQWDEEQWQNLLQKLRTNSGNIIAGLDASGSEPTDAIGPKSHTNDPVLALSEDDYEPIFTRRQAIDREVF